MSDQKPSWPEPNDGSRADLDLGDGHWLTWSEYEGQRVGGIIRHTKADSPTGYCDGAFWLQGNAFTRAHKPGSPEWKMTGTFECPTLEPSFNCHCGNSHGFVRQGKWVGA